MSSAVRVEKGRRERGEGGKRMKLNPKEIPGNRNTHTDTHTLASGLCWVLIPSFSFVARQRPEEEIKKMRGRRKEGPKQQKRRGASQDG